MKGILALDIDGTVTAAHHEMPSEVARFLESLAADGWVLAFITGRTFGRGLKPLQTLRCSYYVAVHNGAQIFLMPEKKLISRSLLDRNSFAKINGICAKHGTDFVICSGMETGDRIFWRPDSYSVEMRRYLVERAKHLNEMWMAVESYEKLPQTHFPALKCFALYDDARQIALELGDDSPCNRDPYDARYGIVQLTHVNAHKGMAVRTIARLSGCSGPVIAAGDDCNDTQLFAAADFAVGMQGGDPDLLAAADHVAPSAAEMGIISGLKFALSSVRLPA